MVLMGAYWSLSLRRSWGGVGDLMPVGRPDFPTLEFGQDGAEVVPGTPVGELVSAPGPGEIWQQGESSRTGEGGEVVTAGSSGTWGRACVWRKSRPVAEAWRARQPPRLAKGRSSKLWPWRVMSAVLRMTLRGAKKTSVRSRGTASGGVGTTVLLVGTMDFKGCFLEVLNRPTAYAQTLVV